MLQRSIQAGAQPAVVIRAGGSVTVEGGPGDRVLAETADRWGLKVELRNAAVEVTVGGNCTVRVPQGATVRVYAGADAAVHAVHTVAAASAGRDLAIRDVQRLAPASAGRDLGFECAAVFGDELKFSAGQDLRCHVHDLADTRLAINDLGGYWEISFGTGARLMRLTAGSVVTLVTAQSPESLPQVVGNIETPPAR